MAGLSHSDIVTRTAHWMTARQVRDWGHKPRLARPPAFLWIEKAVPWTTEMPDVLAVYDIGHMEDRAAMVTVMAEVKASRSDFLSDKRKPHRQPGSGVGDYRLYVCPPHVIEPEDLSDGWGLMWVYSHMCKVLVKPIFRDRPEAVKEKERMLPLHAANYLWRGFAPNLGTVIGQRANA